MGAKGWLSTLDLLPEFGRRLRHHWAAAVMGGTLPGIVLFVWSLFGSLPHWTIGLILVGALLFSGYFTWRDEFLARQKSTQRIRVKVEYAGASLGGNMDSVGNMLSRSIGMQIRLTVFNAGQPTILEDWTLTLPDGEEVLAFKDEMRELAIKSGWPEHRTAEEFTLIQNVQTLAQSPLSMGERKRLMLEFIRRGLEQAKADDLNKSGLYWALKFRDASGAWHIVNLIKRGFVFEAADDLTI